MPTVKRPPRLTIEITEEQQNMLRKHLEHGMQRKVFSVILDDMCRMLEEFGDHFVIALLQKRISYREYMNKYAEKYLEKEAV